MTDRAQTLSAVALSLMSILSYVVLATGFGVYQHRPIFHWILGAAACVWLVVLVRRRFTRGRAIGLGFSVVLLAFFVWWTAVFSEYAVHPPKLAEGAELASELMGVELAAADGTQKPLLRAGEATLIVFYRGYW